MIIMGLDQEILRSELNIIPYINQENGEWIGAKKLIDFRKSYWLHNIMMKIGMGKLNKPIEDLNTVCIPLTRIELLALLDKTKECVKTKSSSLVDTYFDVEVDSEYELDWVLDEMKEFNIVMSRFLKNKKKTEYYYWSWW